MKVAATRRAPRTVATIGRVLSITILDVAVGMVQGAGQCSLLVVGGCW